jgi:hypothetical protein
MHEAMDFAMDANTLREYCKGTQMTILIQLIDQITECGRFIQSYAEDTNFCTSSFCTPTLSLVIKRVPFFRGATFKEYRR